jgi:hypothetical protein
MLMTQEVRVDYFITSEKKLAHLLTTVGGFLSAASGALLPPHVYICLADRMLKGNSRQLLQKTN